ncbi:MAG: SDR family oxidoreductase, partial [Gammaproteobacteria bacterium]|nr:SDR family oxidoreductase [Gammaproteobacteria bacterium]
LGAAQGAFAYGASKWAVRGMTKTAAVELGRRGIRVNSIHPGLIETEMLHQVPGYADGDRLVRRVPLGRVAEADEVARLALFLASDESSYCTGTEFVVDGGLTAS